MEKRKINWKDFHFDINIVPPNQYPDLRVNPSNPYSQMDDLERLENFIQATAEIIVESLKAKKESLFDFYQTDDETNKHR